MLVKNTKKLTEDILGVMAKGPVKDPNSLEERFKPLDEKCSAKEKRKHKKKKKHLKELSSAIKNLRIF